VIHRTFRSLDDPPKLVGFTIRQWAALIGGGILVIAVVHLAQLPAKAAITLFVFTIGLPAALTCVSESGGLQLGVLLRDVCRWRLRAKSLPAASPADRAPGGVLIAAILDEEAENGSHEEAGIPEAEMAFWGRWK
jgi:hypothetical protein